jgi:hypothetical protein
LWFNEGSVPTLHAHDTLAEAPRVFVCVFIELPPRSTCLDRLRRRRGALSEWQDGFPTELTETELSGVCRLQSITSTYDHHTHEFTSEEELNKVAHNLTAALERQNRHYEGLQALRKRGVVMHQGEERPEVTGTQLTLQVCCC